MLATTLLHGSGPGSVGCLLGSAGGSAGTEPAVSLAQNRYFQWAIYPVTALSPGMGWWPTGSLLYNNWSKNKSEQNRFCPVLCVVLCSLGVGSAGSAAPNIRPQRGH